MGKSTKLVFEGHINQVRELEKNVQGFCKAQKVETEIQEPATGKFDSRITFTGSADVLKVLRLQRLKWAARRGLIEGVTDPRKTPPVKKD